MDAFHSMGAAVSGGFDLEGVHYEEGAAGFSEEMKERGLKSVGQRKVKSSNTLLLRARGIHGKPVRFKAAGNFHTVTGCQCERQRNSSRDLILYIVNLVMQPIR